MKEAAEKKQTSKQTNRRHQYVTLDDVLYLKKLLKETAVAILSNQYPGTRHSLTDDEKTRYREQVKQYTFDIYGQSKSVDKVIAGPLCHAGCHFVLFKQNKHLKKSDKTMLFSQIVSEHVSVSSKRVGSSSY